MVTCHSGWFWYNGPYSKAGLGWTLELGVIIITHHFGQVLPAWLPFLLEPVESNLMMKTKTYTAEYHDKTMDFRVVRWDAPVNGVRMGTSIEAFNTEEEAMEVAAILNEGEVLDLYNTQSCEFDS